MTPAEDVRTAGALLSAKAAAALEEMRTNPYWYGGRVTFADGINNACGGAGGQLAAMLSPEAAEPLAALMLGLSEDMRQREAVEGSASKAVHPADFIGLSAPREDWTAALAVARAITGGAS